MGATRWERLDGSGPMGATRRERGDVPGHLGRRPPCGGCASNQTRGGWQNSMASFSFLLSFFPSPFASNPLSIWLILHIHSLNYNIPTRTKQRRNRLAYSDSFGNKWDSALLANFANDKNWLIENMYRSPRLLIARVCVWVCVCVCVCVWVCECMCVNLCIISVCDSFLPLWRKETLLPVACTSAIIVTVAYTIDMYFYDHSCHVIDVFATFLLSHPLEYEINWS